MSRSEFMRRSVESHVLDSGLAIGWFGRSRGFFFGGGVDGCCFKGMMSIMPTTYTLGYFRCKGMGAMTKLTFRIFLSMYRHLGC